MFVVSKLLQYAFLPPGIFILMLIASGIFIGFGMRRLALTVVVTLTAFLLLLSLEPVKDLLIVPLEQAYPVFPTDGSVQAEAIVVLGGGTVARSPEEEGHDSLHPDALKRLVYAFRLHRLTGLPIVTTGGKPLSSPEEESEGLIAERLLRAIGYDMNTPILREEESRNTWENAGNVRERFGLRSIILVTSAYHMPRSVFCFERNGMEVIAAPTDYKTDKVPYDLWSFLPEMQNLSDAAKALKEYVGSFSYRLVYR